MNNKNYVKLLQFVRENWTGLKYRNANGKTWSSDDSKYPSLTDTEMVERFLNEHPLTDTDQNQERKEVDYFDFIYDVFADYNSGLIRMVEAVHKINNHIKQSQSTND